MAVNETRNLNFDLQEGLTDGLLIKRTPDRGGEAETPDHHFWDNEQHGNSVGDGYVTEVADRVYGIDGVKRSGRRAY